MQEEIKEKLKILLAKKEGQANGKTEEPEILIGDLLSGARTKRNDVIEDVVEGICGKSTLEWLEESEEILSSVFLVHLLLNRMGMCARKFEFYYDKNEEEDEAVRNWLVSYRGAMVSEGSLPLEARVSYEQALETYAQKHPMVWEKIWVSWQRLIYELSYDCLSQEALDAWEELCARKLYYTDEEWEFLYALAANLRRGGDYGRANAVYTQMYQNAVMEKKAGKSRMTKKKSRRLKALGMFVEEEEVGKKPRENLCGSQMDEERQLEILPEFCLVYGKFLEEYEVWQDEQRKQEGEKRGGEGEQREQGWEKQEGQEAEEKQGVTLDFVPLWDAEEIFLHGIRLNRKFSRNYFLYELMEAYCKLLYKRISGKRENVPAARTKEEMRADLLRYEQYLTAWEMAQGKYDEAKKRLDFMLEELKWENTTLVHTYNVLARKQV